MATSSSHRAPASVDVSHPIPLIPDISNLPGVSGATSNLGRQRTFVPPVSNVVWGPLTPYLADPTVSDVMVNDYDKIFVERLGGTLERVPVSFASPEAYTLWFDYVAKLLVPGRHDRTLLGISFPNIRVNAVVVPGGRPSISLRLRVNVVRANLDALVEAKCLSNAMADYLRQAGREGANILIAGSTGSGKTTLLKAILAELPGTSAVVEDMFEIMDEGINESCLSRFQPGPQLSQEKALEMAVASGHRRVVLGEMRDWIAGPLSELYSRGIQVLTSTHAGSALNALQRTAELICADRNFANLSENRRLAAAGRTFDVIVGLEVERKNVQGALINRRLVNEICLVTRTGYDTPPKLTTLFLVNNLGGGDAGWDRFDPHTGSVPGDPAEA